MSCPFYNAELRVEDRGMGRVTNHLVTGPGLNNRCALITSAHSPCWMEVGESRAPDWAACPRNPEFVTEVILGLPGEARFNAHAIYMHDMQIARATAAAAFDVARKEDG